MRSFYDTFPRREDGVVLCPLAGKLPARFRPVPVAPRQPRAAVPKHMTAEYASEDTALDSIDDHWPKPHHSEPAREAEDPDVDPRFWESFEASGIRSLQQPAIAVQDWSWQAPAARCRSCAAVIWVASLTDGVRMVRTPKHRKGCSAPPSRLEVELSCAT